MNYLKDKVFLVTGCSSGLGKELAMQMNAKGAFVSGIARRQDKLEELSNEIRFRNNFFSFTGDITNDHDRKEYIKDSHNRFKKIDGIVLNAAISMKGYSIELGTDLYRKTMDTNFFSAIELMKLVFNEIKSNKGDIVIIGSLMGMIPYPYRSGYVASKHALNGWAESVKLENYNTGPNIMTVYCGYMRTEISAKSLTNNPSLVAGTSSGSKKGSDPAEVAAKIIKGVEERKDKLFPVKTSEKILMQMYKYFPAFLEKKYLSKRTLN